MNGHFEDPWFLALAIGIVVLVVGLIWTLQGRRDSGFATKLVRYMLMWPILLDKDAEAGGRTRAGLIRKGILLAVLTIIAVLATIFTPAKGS